VFVVEKEEPLIEFIEEKEEKIKPELQAEPEPA
jgi:hypothetical protein